MGRSDRRKHSSKAFARLEPRVLHVSEAIIKKKWRKLPPTNYCIIRELLYSAKEQSRTRRGKQIIDPATENSVKEVADSLAIKLSRIPYPPATEEQHFDEEINIHRLNRIEEQVNANTQSMMLLKAQLVKEEDLLRQDEAEFEYLESSLRSTETVRRQQERTWHPVARNSTTEPLKSETLNLSNDSHRTETSDLLTLFYDDDMLPVLEQLQSHLNSMYYNSQHIQEVKDVIEAAGFDLTTFKNTSDTI